MNGVNASKRILVVEDDQFLREFYQELLSSEGYTVDVAADGEIALNKIKQGGWNLILLDIMLPKKDGLHILNDLRNDPLENPNGSIIILTNLGQDSVINQAFGLGAAGYLIKSAMNPAEILTEIHGYLDKKNDQG